MSQVQLEQQNFLKHQYKKSLQNNKGKTLIFIYSTSSKTIKAK